jgi:uncharacterized iron-regulated membrane protein
VGQNFECGVQLHGVTLWQRWLRQPQRIWLRRAAFQIHLWIGLAIGLYIVMLSVTGSVLVYRNELDRYFATPRPLYERDRKILTSDELKAVAERAYPGYTITRLGDRISRRNPTLEVWLERDGDKKERLFNPYTGEELGASVTQGEYFVLWLARLHDDLLFDREGRFWNGILSLIATVLFVTGIVVWWPGVSRWRRGLILKRGVGWKRFNWDLHSMLGFWLFLFMLMWGISGFYLGVPEPFSNFVDAISDPDAFLGDRPGDIALAWLTRLHFGRWRNMPWLKATWAVLGLVPALMFVTGAVMWWNRVLRRRPIREAEDAAESAA